MARKRSVVGSAESGLYRRLEKLLLLSNQHKAMDDARSSGPAPLDPYSREPLAENRKAWNRRLILDEIRTLLRHIERWGAALQRPGDEAFARLLGDVQHALKRMYGDLHPAQPCARWREGSIPQRRHLKDPAPSSIPQASDFAAPEPTPRFEQLEREVERAAFNALRRGVPASEVDHDPVVARAKDRVVAASRAVFKQRARTSPRLVARGPSQPPQHLNEMVRAYEEHPERVKDWEADEAAIRSFLDYAGKTAFRPAGDTGQQNPPWRAPGLSANQQVLLYMEHLAEQSDFQRPTLRFVAQAIGREPSTVCNTKAWKSWGQAAVGPAFDRRERSSRNHHDRIAADRIRHENGEA